jgi:hypothetical protein
MQFIRKQMRRLGSFYHRSFLFTYAGGLPIRLKGFFLSEDEE